MNHDDTFMPFAQGNGLVVLTKGPLKGTRGVYYQDEIHGDERKAAIYLIEGKKKDDIIAVLHDEFEECYDNIKHPSWIDVWRSPRNLGYGPVTVLFGPDKGMVGYYDEDEWVDESPDEEFEALEPYAVVVVGDYKKRQYKLVPHVFLMNINTVANERYIKELDAIRPGLAEESGFYRIKDNN